MSELWQHLLYLLRGVDDTVILTLGGAIVAAVLAFSAGLGRRSKDLIVRGLSGAYVEVFRGTSVLVQLFWFYYVLPYFGLDLPAMATGIMVLGLNVGAYGAEVVRGAIEDVPKGQWEAGVALNLTPWQQLRHVILPQAVLPMIPPFGNLLIELLKASALVSLIAIHDITKLAYERRDDRGDVVTIFLLVLVLYFALSLLITFAMRKLERYLARGRDHGGVH
jgi:polar amino acid transport system permease protein